MRWVPGSGDLDRCTKVQHDALSRFVSYFMELKHENHSEKNGRNLSGATINAMNFGRADGSGAPSARLPDGGRSG